MLKNKKSTLLRLTISAVLVAAFMVFVSIYCKVDKTEMVSTTGRTFEKAVVTAIISDNMQEDGTRVGSQTVKVRLTTGELKGREFEATSSDGNLFGATCYTGSKVIVIVSTSGDNSLVSVYSIDRGWAVIGFVLIFFAAVVITVITTAVTMYLIGGVSVKTVSSIIGTIFGVLIAGISAWLFGIVAGIDGYNVSNIETLLYVGQVTKIQIGGLLFSGILIASLGAVMDVAMSVSSTIAEIHDKKPELNSFQLFESGMTVGKDMMGTMSNTLILAFAGGSLSTLVINYAYDLPFLQIINSYSIGIEIMQGIAGSLGVILTVPCVSAISAVLQARYSKKKNN